MRYLCACLALLLLSACATNTELKELRQLTPRGTPYAIALTDHYLKFSEAEARTHDWTDSSYFAEKGLMAGYGQVVTAEEIHDWQIPEDLKPELLAAREKLMMVVTNAAQQAMPQESARAVFAFDCWLEELEEGWDKPAIQACQEQFYQALNVIEFTDLESQMMQDIENTAYLVYFGSDKTDFDNAAKQVVHQVLEDASFAMPQEIVIHGHTDTVGSEEYNMQLSQKRALSVLEALIKGGIPQAILKYFAFGESDPAVDRGDNKPERKNRRVEIFIG